jgi:hypothetical protein
MPPHKVKYDSAIMKLLDSTFIEIPGYRPWLNFTDLFRRVKQIHPEITEVTLTRHLHKMVNRKILIRYGPDGSKLARNNRIFYRINPGTNSTQRPNGRRSLYHFLSWHKSFGHIIETRYAENHITVQINKRPTFPMYTYDSEYAYELLLRFPSLRNSDKLELIRALKF